MTKHVSMADADRAVALHPDNPRVLAARAALVAVVETEARLAGIARGRRPTEQESADAVATYEAAGPAAALIRRALDGGVV